MGVPLRTDLLPDTVEFKSRKEKQTVAFEVVNKGEGPQMYKIKTTNGADYTIKPVYFSIELNEKRRVNVTYKGRSTKAPTVKDRITVVYGHQLKLNTSVEKAWEDQRHLSAISYMEKRKYVNIKFKDDVKNPDVSGQKSVQGSVMQKSGTIKPQSIATKTEQPQADTSKYSRSLDRDPDSYFALPPGGPATIKRKGSSRTEVQTEESRDNRSKSISKKTEATVTADVSQDEGEPPAKPRPRRKVAPPPAEEEEEEAPPPPRPVAARRKQSPKPREEEEEAPRAPPKTRKPVVTEEEEEEDEAPPPPPPPKKTKAPSRRKTHSPAPVPVPDDEEAPAPPPPKPKAPSRRKTQTPAPVTDDEEAPAPPPPKPKAPSRRKTHTPVPDDEETPALPPPKTKPPSRRPVSKTTTPVPSDDETPATPSPKTKPASRRPLSKPAVSPAPTRRPPAPMARPYDEDEATDLDAKTSSKVFPVKTDTPVKKKVSQSSPSPNQKPKTRRSSNKSSGGSSLDALESLMKDSKVVYYIQTNQGEDEEEESDRKTKKKSNKGSKKKRRSEEDEEEEQE